MSCILSQLSRQKLEIEAEDPKYPKWQSICLLKLLGLPVLNAAVIKPDYADDVLQTATDFGEVIGSKVVMVRSDGGTEALTQYYRGGISFPIESAVREAHTLITQGRAVIFVEPTNRFQNRLTINLVIVKEPTCEFIIELLSEGYDASDLNRGSITPQVTVRAELSSWDVFEDLRPFDFRIRVDQSQRDQEDRRDQRLKRLSYDILPRLGIVSSGDLKGTIHWLKMNKYTGIWSDRQPVLTYRKLLRLYEDAYFVANIPTHRHSIALAISASVLWDYRFVYWDVVDSKRKFTLGLTPFQRCYQI